MDIYTASKASSKLYEFFLHYANQDRNMYNSTIEKLDKIRIQSNAVSESISLILHDNHKESNSTHNCDINIHELSDAVYHMYKIHEFMSVYSNSESSDSNQLKFIVGMCRDICKLYDEASYESDAYFQSIDAKLDKITNILTKDSNELSKQSNTSDLSSKDSCDTNKHSAMVSYTAAFKALSEADISYDSISLLRNLLCKWFDERFKDGFKYKFDDFKSWIVAIIVSFGYSLQTDSITSYYNMFDNWIDQISTHPDRYSLPYKVFSFYKSPNPHFDGTIAHILYDMLYDSGLKFAHKEGSLYLNDDMISEWETSHNIICKHEYNYYKSEPDILRVYGIC